MSKIKLEEILKNKNKEIVNWKKREPIEYIKRKIAKSLSIRNFKGAFYGRGESIGIIAEVKAKSPSESIITKTDPLEIAKEYEESKAVAISVLTDELYFGGSLDLMEKVKRRTSKPILRKDFIIDEYQIYQSRAYGADAILLISYILSKEKLSKFIKVTKKLGMDCLIELHSKEDLKKIPKKTEIYGINNRSLTNGFKTDLDVTFNLIEYIPKGKLIISESGVKSPRHIKRLKDVGVNGVLTGTSILKTLKESKGYSPQKAIDFLLSRN